MTALATEPRPPPSELPPRTAAVSAETSSPTPVSAPVLPMRAAKQEAGERAQKPRPDIGHADRAAHLDAGVVGRAPRAADRGQPPARAASATARCARRTRCTAVTISEKGQPRTVPAPRKVQTIGIGEAGNDRRRHPQKDDVVDRAEDDQRHQRRQERAKPEIADQIAVDGAADDAERHDRAGSSARPASPRRSRRSATAEPTRAKTDATERSMPPEIITMVSAETRSDRTRRTAAPRSLSAVSREEAREQQPEYRRRR